MPRKLGLLLLLLLSAIALIVPSISADYDPFFSPVTNAPASGRTEENHVLRTRAVRANIDLLENGLAETITLNLFSDTSIVAERIDIFTSPAVDGYVWIGQAKDDPSIQILLSVNGQALVGNIKNQGEELFVIHSVGIDLQEIVQVDSSLLLEPPAIDDTIIIENEDENISNMMVPPRSNRPASDIATTHGNFCVAGQETGEVIDMLIAYTPDAAVAEGGNGAIEALINMRVADMNLANTSSSVTSLMFNLVHTMETAYTESGDNAVDLPRFRTMGDGFMDDVPPARDTYNADLVELYTSEGTTGGCGLAYLMVGLNPGFEASAYGVTHLDYVAPFTCSSLTLAHEAGHNLGLNHDRANTTNPMGAFTYSFGYQDPTEVFRTIMAYDCPGGCPRVNYWSNPTVLFGGSPMGVVETSPAAANNALSLSNSSYTTANFRNNCYSPQVILNEVNYDNPGTDSAEFVEIKNIYTGTVNIDNIDLVLINGGTNTIYDTINLPNVNLAQGDYYVVCSDSANVPNCDLDVPTNSNWLQNGNPDAIALVDNIEGFVIDTISYGGNTSSPYTEVTGATTDLDTIYWGLSRYPEADTNQNNLDWARHCISPGVSNVAATSDCNAELNISKSVDPVGAIDATETLTYTIVLTDVGNVYASTILTDVFDADLLNVSCSAELTTYEYATSPVNLGTFSLDIASCIDAQMATSTLFDETGNPSTTTSPLSCTINVPVDAVVTDYDVSMTWNPEPCAPTNCFSFDVDQIDVTSPSGAIDANTFFLGSGTTGNFTHNILGESDLSSQLSQGAWSVSIYDKSTTNNGHTLIGGSITLYGYPLEATTTAISAQDLTSGAPHLLNHGETIRYQCTGTVSPNLCTQANPELNNTAQATAIEALLSPVSSNTVVSDVECGSLAVELSTTGIDEPVVFPIRIITLISVISLVTLGLFIVKQKES